MDGEHDGDAVCMFAVDEGAGLAGVLFGLPCGNIVGSRELLRCRWMLGTLGPGVLEGFAVNGDYYSTISGGVVSHARP